MTDTTKSEALRLAEQLRDMTTRFKTPSHERGVCNGAIQELRRLHAENEALRNALEGVMYWDNGKAEWEIAREALARAGEKT